MGAVIGGGFAAITGGNIAKGALAGAIGGGFGAWGGRMGVVGGTVCAGAGGAVGALVTDDDPMTGAMTAGISAGVGACFETSPLAGMFGDIENDFGALLRLSTASGAFCGGVTSEIFGGGFGQGAMWGAGGSAAGLVLTVATDNYLMDTPAADLGWSKAEVFEVSLALEHEPSYSMLYLGSSQDRLEAGEKHGWWTWTKSVVKGAFYEGPRDGVKIAVFHDSKTAQKYGTVGTASNVCGYVSDAAFLAAGGISAGKAIAKASAKVAGKLASHEGVKFTVQQSKVHIYKRAGKAGINVITKRGRHAIEYGKHAKRTGLHLHGPKGWVKFIKDLF